MKLSLWILFVALTLSACGGGNTDKSATTNTSSNPSELSSSSSSNPSELSSSSSSNPSAHYVITFSGNNQLSQPNTPLPLEPMARVSDKSDLPIAGVKVNFSITTGNGDIQYSSAITDSMGIASAGKWNPGSNIGVNTLTASVDGLPPTIFTTRTGRSSPNITLSEGATNGHHGSGVPDYHSNLILITSVDSTFQLKSVTATANGTAVNIQNYLFDRPGEIWATYYSDFNAIPSGPLIYIVTVTDIFDNTTDIVFPSMILDRKPTLSILNIKNNSVIQRPFDLHATCTDDFGCAYIELRPPFLVGHDIRIQGNSLVYPIDASALTGNYLQMDYTAADKPWDVFAEYRSYDSKTISFYIESSPFLTFVTEASEKILDISNNRVLLIDTPSQTNIPTLIMLDLLTNTKQIIAEDHGLKFLPYGDARIIEEGVVYKLDPSEIISSDRFIFEWKQNAISTISKTEREEFSKNANWLIYFDGDSFWKRNLTDGTSTLVNDIPDTAEHVQITSQGDIVWSNGSDIYLLTADANTPELVASGSKPSTDSINIAYRKDGACCQIAVHNGTEETVLSTQLNEFPSYIVEGGYVAYKKERQIWLYHNGDVQQLTVFGNLSAINLETIAPDGTISLTYNNKRYVKKPGAELKEIGSGLGKPFFSGNKLYIIIGYTILEAAL